MEKDPHIIPEIERYYAGEISSAELLNYNEPEFVDEARVENELLDNFFEGTVSLAELLAIEELWLNKPDLRGVITDSRGLLQSMLASTDTISAMVFVSNVLAEWNSINGSVESGVSFIQG